MPANPQVDRETASPVTSRGQLPVIRESRTPRYLIGVALVVGALVLNLLTPFLFGVLGLELSPVVTMVLVLLQPMLAILGFLVLPGKLFNRVIAAVIVVVIYFGGSFVGRAISGSIQSPDLEFALLRCWAGFAAASYVASWLIARNRSRAALAIVLPACFAIFTLLSVLSTVIPFPDISAIYPLYLIVQFSLRVGAAWVAWAIDQRKVPGPARATI